MKTSLKGLVEIASHEGVVPMPYFDSVGVLTFGIGHTNLANIPPDPRDLPRGVEQPMSMVFDVFAVDIERFARDVDRVIKVAVSQAEFDSAVSFHFNTGGIFRATWVKSLNRGNRRRATQQIMNWTRPPEIISRRRKEQSLFATGSYTSGGYAPVYRANKRGRVIWPTGTRMNVMKMLGDDQSDAPITGVLRPGAKGYDVVRLQKRLKIPADGQFGPQTKGAVMDYQEHNGLLVDGIAGPQTLGHMGLA